MLRHRNAAAVRLSSAWTGLGSAWGGAGPQSRRYRARPQDLPPGRSCISALPPLLPTLPRVPPLRPPHLPLPPTPPFPHPPQALSPPEDMEGDITTVDGRREDDIDVRDPSPPSSSSSLFLLRTPTPFFAAPPPPGPSPPRRPPPRMEEHLAVMHEKLRHELPNFFLKIPDYGLYSHDVEFVNHHLHLHTRGRAMYQVAVTLCRAAVWGYFAGVRLEVLALTRHPEECSIRARWRLTGVPFHLCLLRFYRRDKRDLLRSYDAFSTFTLDAQGLIRLHRVDKLTPAPTALPEAKKLLVAAAVAVTVTVTETLGTGTALHPAGPPEAT